MSEFWKRTLSGAVYVAVIITSILEEREILFVALAPLMAVLAVREFNRLLHPRNGSDVLCDFCACLLVLGAGITGIFWQYGMPFLAAYLVLLIITLIFELWRKADNPIANWGTILIGQSMIAVPFASMIALFYLDKWLLLALFVLIWVNDTGAYCVGSLTAKQKGGNHKMFPRVSPKKSWEGLFGGIAFAIGAAYIMHRFGWFDKIVANNYKDFVVIPFALLAGGFGTLGDLMESLMKRTIGVKDSGRFLPGHGGVLDRFDSMLLAAPIVALFSWLCYAWSLLV